MVAPLDHEYSVMGGTNRAKVGRLLGLVAGSISSGLVFAVLQAVDLAQKLGWNVNVPPTVLSLAGAGTVFALLYWVLSKWAWKWPGIAMALKVPDVSGTWDCVGQKLDAITGKPQEDWQAEVKIVQTWDKLRIRFTTKTSGSSSITAALSHDSVDGYVLLYHYRNDPKPGAVGLAAHAGCAVMTIAKDRKSASGDYFNGRGRQSFGTMNWTRRD